jgi:lipopolysaccharide/colanic/teichoic acid biosynthesis glycosyltransferase/protein involved in polysaccharide export with SLBB domain
MVITSTGTARRWPGFASARVERILVLGMTPLAKQVIAHIEARARRRQIVGVLDECELARQSAADFEELLDRLEPHRIVVALTERRGRTPMRPLLESRLWRGVIIEDVADCYERLTGKLALESLTPMDVIFSSRFCPPSGQQSVARLLSVLAAAAALIALSPVLLLVTVLIKLDDIHGPVLFRQRRVGLHGRPFTLVKFRTMRHDHARRSEWEGDNRDAITRVGKWLRAFRVDELPQFFNILAGDMNLVGPRPHPITNFELFTLVARNLNEQSGAAISCYELRTLVRPGLTGWAQVRYRYANNLEEELEKLRYDLYYLKHISLWLDLRILLETAKVVRGQTTREVTMSKPAPVRSLDVVRRTSLVLILALAVPALSDAQSAAAPGSAASASAAGTRARTTNSETVAEYLIGADDELEIAVWNNEAVTRTVLVRPDGRISLPLINDVQAAGLTPMQLQTNVAKALGPFIQNPDVAVIVKAVHSYKVSVMGEVKEPGRFELGSRATVLDVLAMAKGFNEYADKGRIVVLRRENGVTKQYSFQYMRLLQDNGESGRDNFFVQPGDIVLVR